MEQHSEMYVSVILYFPVLRTIYGFLIFLYLYESFTRSPSAQCTFFLDFQIELKIIYL